MTTIFESTRVLLSLYVLLYASWSDWKKREVSNWVWVIFAPPALVLTTLQYMLVPQELLPQELLLNYAISFAVTFALSTALFYAGAFGGADAKALMCLALALPQPVSLLSQASIFSPLQIFPITVFSNAVLLAALSIFYALFRNIFWRLSKRSSLFAGFEHESVWRKMLALVTGYKVELATLQRKNVHLYPLEDIKTEEAGRSQRRLLVYPKDETQEAILARIASAGREGKIPNGVWVTPGLPLLIFITTGLVIALLFGDIIWWLLQSVLIPR